MKTFIASVAALGLLASPALAQTTSSKTMTTKGAKSTATTTVTTKVAPNKHMTMHRRHHMMHSRSCSPVKMHMTHKTAMKSGTAGSTKMNSKTTTKTSG